MGVPLGSEGDHGMKIIGFYNFGHSCRTMELVDSNGTTLGDCNGGGGGSGTVDVAATTFAIICLSLGVVRHGDSNISNTTFDSPTTCYFYAI